jgi:hypothetical protein
VINEAIRENAGWDTICRCGVVLFGLTGSATIVAAVVQKDVGLGAVGAVAAALCWPAVHYARSIRKENVSLRLLELALNNVTTAEQALAAINKAFLFSFGREEGGKSVVPRSKAEDAGRGS